MRITDSMNLNNIMQYENFENQQVSQLSLEAADGDLINAPSDNPFGYGELVTLDSQISVMQGRSEAASAASSNLDSASSALNSVVTLLQQAQQLATEGANGTEDAQDRQDTATSVQGIIQQVISLGNSQGPDGSYLFGGSDTTTPPFDSQGNYSGNNEVTKVAVGDNVLVNSNVSGSDAFTSSGGGSNIIADLQSLETALNNNDVSGISSSISQMQSDQQQVTAVMVQAGTQSSTLQASSQVLANAITTATTQRSTLDNAATPQLYSQLSAAETAYQASIGVNQQILSLNAFANNE